MAYEPAYPSGTNTFIPTMNGEATAGLVVNFSRNPKDFKLPRWASYTPVKRWQGYFLRMNIDQCARVLDIKGNRNIWPRGNDAPQLTWNTEAFAWQPFLTERYAYGFVLPDDAEQQGDFSPMTQNNAVEAARAMTQRTQMAVTAATLTSNYDASHVDTATNWGGGYLNAGTDTDPIFKRALETMYRRVHLDTRGTVRPSDMVVVMDPALAHLISQSSEIHKYLSQSPYALPQLTGNTPGQNDNWGLPPYYAGFKIEVEDSVKVTTPKSDVFGQEGTYVWPWGTMAMLARPGGLVSPEGATSFSTVHIFLKEDMTVEQFSDPINRRTTARIVDDFSAAIVAPVSGVLATATLAEQPPSSLIGGSDTPPEPGTFVPVSVGPEFQAQMDRLWSELDKVRQDNDRLRAELSVRSTNPEETGRVTPVPLQGGVIPNDPSAHPTTTTAAEEAARDRKDTGGHKKKG